MKTGYSFSFLSAAKKHTSDMEKSSYLSVATVVACIAFCRNRIGSTTRDFIVKALNLMFFPR